MKGNQTRAYLTLIFVCLVWGTTYLAIRVGVLHFPPFLFAGIRQVISGAILVIASLMIYKKADWSRKNILMQAFIGFLLITLGNGLVTWGEVQVPSGVAALVCSIMPIFAVLFNLAIAKERFNGYIAGGLLLGFGGVAIIFKDSISELGNSAYLISIIALMTAAASWAYGSIISKKQPKSVNPVFNSGLQLFFGGALMLLVSPIVDDYSNVHGMDKEAFLSLLYLIVFGSVLAYAAYIYTLSNLPIGISTIYAYFNPLIAVILGYFLLNEPLNAGIWLAFVAIMTGVYLVNKGYRSQKKEAVATVPEN